MLFIIKQLDMEKKRKYRQLSDETKAKISQSMRNRSKSLAHKENISSGLKKYWQTVPNKPINTDGDEE